jgi:hypothetical protein
VSAEIGIIQNKLLIMISVFKLKKYWFKTADSRLTNHGEKVETTVVPSSVGLLTA